MGAGLYASVRMAVGRSDAKKRPPNVNGVRAKLTRELDKSSAINSLVSNIRDSGCLVVAFHANGCLSARPISIRGCWRCTARLTMHALTEEDS